MACQCIRIKKESAGGAGNFKYTFSCTNDSGQTNKLYYVTCGNDNEAQQLVELECSEDDQNNSKDKKIRS
jgi:hypothetical protein